MVATSGEALNGWLFLATVSIVVAAILHWRIERFWIATVLASLFSLIIAVLIGAALDGGFDAFGGMVALIGLVVSIPVSCLVGAVFVGAR